MSESAYNFPVITGVETGQGPSLMELARRIYNRSSVGCCLHVLLDDGNTDDETAHWVANHAIEVGHMDCVNVAMCLSAQTEEQRIAFRNELHGHARNQTPEADSGDHPGGDRADVARHDEVTECPTISPRSSTGP